MLAIVARFFSAKSTYARLDHILPATPQG